MTTYIDTHIHLDLLAAPERELEKARQSGIVSWVVPGVDPDGWNRLMAAVGRYEGSYAAPGVHPREAGKYRSSHLDQLRELLQHPRAVALGEVGLDRQAESTWQSQENVFVQMLRLAREMNKPLLIHARRSMERILELLRQEEAQRVGGIFHAFSGSLETANKIIDMGFVLGVGGVVTFEKAKHLPEVVRRVPGEMLVLETDAPDMTPEPYRGRPNQPAYLELIADKVAALRGWSREETAAITTANACRILDFGN